MKPLTINQLRLLAEIQREAEGIVETTGMDFKILEMRKLIKNKGSIEHPDYILTNYGKEFIYKTKNLQYPLDMSTLLNDLFFFNYSVTIGSSQIYNMAKITVADDNTGESYEQQLPRDHHLNESLIGCIEYAKNKLIEQIKNKTK